MRDILLTVAALDADDVPTTLRFSVGGYKDDAANLYQPRIANAPLLTISPNDGGLLTLFNSAGVTESIGDIALNNIDGALDYLVTYAVDGRSATIASVNNGTVTDRFSGTVGRMTEQNGQIIFALKARHETMTDNHPLDIYAGDNVLPAGLEGTEDTIKGNPKPRVYGDCRNISPVLVNSSLQIYQASSLTNCRITAVYDDGVRLTNYQTNGAHAVDDVVIALDNGVGPIGVGKKVVFANHKHVYSLAAGLSGGHVTLAEGLLVAVPDNTPVDLVNFYDESGLQTTDYFTAADLATGATAIAVTGGIGAIAVGDLIVFGSHLAVYVVATALSAGTFVIEDGLLEEVGTGDTVHVIGDATPVLWGGWHGYFRLTAKPAGTVTCDAMSIDDNGDVHAAGAVFGLIASDIGFVVDAGNAAIFNAAGTLGLYVDAQMTTAELLNKVALSVAGFYQCIGTDVSLNLLTAPATDADWTLEDWQIDMIERSATGLGANGVPIYKTVCQYDRIETVQATVAGFTSSAWRQRLKTQTREKALTDATVQTRHPLSLALMIDSLLRSASDVTALLSRVMPIVKQRRDVVSIVMPVDQAPSLAIGSTGLIVTPKLGYASGRKLVLIGYELDDDNHTVTLRLFG